MTDLPAAAYFSNNDRTEGEIKQWGEDVRDVIAELLGGSDEEQITIDGGVVTPTKALVAIDTEAQTSADDLDRIDPANHPEGRLLLVRAADPARAVTVKHLAGGTGQIETSTTEDVELDPVRGLLLRRSGARWVSVLGSGATQDIGTAATRDIQTSATDTTLGRLPALFDRGDGEGRIPLASLPVSRWEMVGPPWDHSVDGDAAVVDFTDLERYDEIFVYVRAVSMSVAGKRNFRLSTNNGSSFFSSSGDYRFIDDTGSSTNIDRIEGHGTDSDAVRYAFLHMQGTKRGGPEMTVNSLLTGGAPQWTVPASDEDQINAVRVFASTGNFTAGIITCYGRKTYE